MAALEEQRTIDEQDNMFYIMEKDLFELHNKDVKDLIEHFKQYEDGQESIDGFGLRVYESYDEYVKEQQLLREQYESKMKFHAKHGGDAPVNPQPQAELEK